MMCVCLCEIYNLPITVLYLFCLHQMQNPQHTGVNMNFNFLQVDISKVTVKISQKEKYYFQIAMATDATILPLPSQRSSYLLRS